MTTIRNLTKSPYNLQGGYRVPPMGEADVTGIDPAYLEMLVRSGQFETFKDADESDLRSVAAGLGVKIDGRWSAARVQKEIDRALEAA